MSTKGRLALVTGAAGGIGGEICMRLLKDGYRVIGTGSSKHDDIEYLVDRTTEQARYVICNICDRAACDNLAEQLKDEQVDVLVNCAGITRDGLFRKMTDDMWDDVIETNLTGAFNISKRFVPLMAERKYGRVINISSINGQKGQFGQTNYSAAKAGLHGFTKALAQEVVRKGVTVNTVSPGYIATSMILQMDEKVRDAVRDQIPVGRFGTPEEIARLVSFLADEQSGFMTGADFSINGGQHMH